MCGAARRDDDAADGVLEYRAGDRAQVARRFRFDTTREQRVARSQHAQARERDRKSAARAGGRSRTVTAGMTYGAVTRTWATPAGARARAALATARADG